MKGVQCYELFGGIELKMTLFSFFHICGIICHFKLHSIKIKLHSIHSIACILKITYKTLMLYMKYYI